MSLLTEGLAVLTGSGTTMLELARLISDALEATFFILSSLVADKLLEYSSLIVILIDGRLSKNGHINMGPKQ